MTEFSTKTLREALEARLPNVLGRQPKIFYDSRDVLPGDDWREALGAAHRDSRCLVAVLCGDYFNSAHCRGEFDSMLARGGNAVIAVRWGDGQWWSAAAGALQVEDMSTWATRRWSGVKENQGFLRAVDRVCVSIFSACDRAVWSVDAPLLRPAQAARPTQGLPEIGR